MNTPRKTLGRGLGELMFEVGQVDNPLSVSTDRAFLQLPVDGISDPNATTELPQPTPPDALLQSLKTHGLLQPILARKQDAGYVVIDGRKRLQAARELGFKTIPALVLNSPDADASVLAAEANRRQPDAPPHQEPAAPTPSMAEPPIVTFLPQPGNNPDAISAPSEVLPPPAVAQETPAAAAEQCTPPLAMSSSITSQQDGWLVPLAIAAGALILGIAGTLWFTDATTSMSRISTGTSTRTSQAKSMAAPEKAATVTITNIVTLPPPQRKTPAWMTSLTVDGLTTLATNDTVAITFDKPIFARYTTLAPDASNGLKKLAAALIASDASLQVRVCGHTDDTPVRSGGPFRDNFAVGLARAAHVVEYLRREGGMASAEFTTSSAGDSNPPYPNDSTENRLKNRTVTIVVSERTAHP